MFRQKKILILNFAPLGRGYFTCSCIWSFMSQMAAGCVCVNTLGKLYEAAGRVGFHPSTSWSSQSNQPEFHFNKIQTWETLQLESSLLCGPHNQRKFVKFNHLCWWCCLSWLHENRDDMRGGPAWTLGTPIQDTSGQVKLAFSQHKVK